MTSFGVLPHIPNVTHVLAEIAWALAGGGLFTMREPISWMGDRRRDSFIRKVAPGSAFWLFEREPR